MNPEGPEPATVSAKGKISVAIAVVLVALVSVFFPAYRLFFGISVGIGIIVAAILQIRNKYFPVKVQESHDHKRPLGL